jgi:protein-tyrosine phosphatase
VTKIVDEEIIKNGSIVLVHCMGGLGRAGIFAAACLIYRGFPVEEAIKLVREVRSPKAV